MDYTMTVQEKIEFMLIKRGKLSYSEVGRRLGVTGQTFGVKMKKQNYTVKDLEKIAGVLGYHVEINFIDDESGEKI